MDLSRLGLRAPVAVACAVFVLALAACGGGGSDAKAKTPSPAGTKLTLTPGAVQVAAAGNPGTLSDADKTAIMTTLRRYIVAATIDPLHGKPVGKLDQVFTPAALTALIGPNRDAVVDDGMPKATSTVVAKNPPVPLTALSDQSGAREYRPKRPYCRPSAPYTGAASKSLPLTTDMPRLEWPSA